jgi:hypothetical protein
MGEVAGVDVGVLEGTGLAEDGPRYASLELEVVKGDGEHLTNGIILPQVSNS